MSSSEFIATSPIQLHDIADPKANSGWSSASERARSLLRFSIKFDPYSPTKADDYEALKQEIERFDIIGMLQAELSKSRVHIALARKIVSVIRYLEQKQKDQAILSLLENVDLLYPIFSNVLLVIKQLFDSLSPNTQDAVIEHIIKLLREGSHVLRVELNLSYAVRVLAAHSSASVQETLVKLYNSPNRSAFIRRDIILAMTRLGAWHWLSDRRISFRSMEASERRAFLIASYSLKDEGRHWRKHIADELSPFERLVRAWASQRSGQPGWVVPL